MIFNMGLHRCKASVISSHRFVRIQQSLASLLYAISKRDHILCLQGGAHLLLWCIRVEGLPIGKGNRRLWL